MRDDGLNKKAATAVYWPLLTKPFTETPESRPQLARGVTVVIRSTRTGANGFVNELSQAVWAINPNLPVSGVRTLQEIYDASMARTSFTLVMLGIAGGMALLLGVGGLYGVISYSVSQRSREIGIRIALGAQARAVTRMFVTHGLALAGVGVAIGLAVALSIMRLMSSLLFDVSPLDPLTYVLVAADADCRDPAGQLRPRPARDDGGSDRRAAGGVGGNRVKRRVFAERLQPPPRADLFHWPAVLFMRSAAARRSSRLR